MAHVLVVEDEPAIAEMVNLHLHHAGHRSTWAADGAMAKEVVARELPDAVILDWMLPHLDGLTLLRLWRDQERTAQMPVLMLSARAADHELSRGLDNGADDYLTKPFSPIELMARLRGLLRRQSPRGAMHDAPLRVGELMLDPLTARVSCTGGPVKLGPKEFKLLKYLMSHPDRVLSRTQLLDGVWGEQVVIEERTVDVHIKRLREALSSQGAGEPIETVRGMGYRIVRQGDAGSNTTAAW